MSHKIQLCSSFIKWIKLLYTKPLISIKNNGYISDHFEIYRGVRQGCPISCLLFILCIEFLGEAIRKNELISGIKLHDSYIKISQYADDATIFLSNEHELDECIETIKRFGQHSGMVLNMSKCEGLWLRNLKNRQTNCKLKGIKWPTIPIKCLGIYVGHNKDECDRLNWTNKITKLKNILEIWKCRRNLTLFGKVQVIKCLAMAGLIYTAINCALPSNDIISIINSEIYHFLWGKSEKIKRRVLINTIENGGINMLDVKSHFESLKAAWIPRLIHDNGNNMGHWTDLPLHFLNKLGNSLFILETNIIDLKTQNLPLIPKFYEEVITAFNRSKSTTEEEFKSNLLQQPIFGNKYITYTQGNKSKCPYIKHWINSGIKYIKDLKINNGKIDVTYIHHKMTNKRNIHNEILIVMKSLKKHVIHISNDPSNVLPITHISIDKIKKAKYFYLKLVSQIQEKSHVEYKWNISMNMNITFTDVYLRKISNIKDKKIAEFNYKIIHNILPCGVNLLKWKKKDHDKCDICGQKETIEHLIFECTYASTL